MRHIGIVLVSLAMVWAILGCSSGGGGGGSKMLSGEFGEFEDSYNLLSSRPACVIDGWPVDVTLKCSACEKGKTIAPTGAQLFLFQYTQNIWTELETVDLPLDTETAHTIDLTSMQMTCDDVDTAVILIPIGPNAYGHPSSMAFESGDAWQGTIGGSNFEIACDSKVVVRAEAVRYNYLHRYRLETMALAPPSGPCSVEEITGDCWTGQFDQYEPSSEMVILFGYDAQDAVRCFSII